MREYVAETSGPFHDIRADARGYRPLYDPESYVASQRFALDLLASGSNGIVYRSVRREGGTCLACFRPRLLAGVRVAGHYEYRWNGGARPAIRRVNAPPDDDAGALTGAQHQSRQTRRMGGTELGYSAVEESPCPLPLPAE